MPLSKDSFALAPDPDDALRWRERLADAGLTDFVLEQAGADAIDVTWLACTQAPYLAMLAIRDPQRLLAAAGDPYLRREKPKHVLADELARALEGTPDGLELGRRLRAFRAREYIRLGARECGLGDPAEVGRELAHLADATIDAAIRFYDAELTARHGEPRFTDESGVVRKAGLVVFGMGKMGGLELNFASDVDLIHVYSSDNGAAGDLSLHEYFDKLARRMQRTISEVTEDDWVFRVDMRLRPEGTRGPLVNSLPSTERYYESWGRPWERQAWLKARPAAGDLALGAEMLDVLEPFIYPRTVGPNVIREVEDLNRRIKAELDGKGLGGGFDVKLGHGGIREIEFFVQALQLVHAGKNPSLRERGTRAALDKLLFAGLVAEKERRALAEAYHFLRQVEHRLQLVSGRQTHRLPDDTRGMTTLAGRLGFGSTGELTSTLALHTEAVSAIFSTLSHAPPLRPEIAAVLDPLRPAAETHDALLALGFKDVKQAALQLDPLRADPTGHVAPQLIQELAASPDPDQALSYAVDFLRRFFGQGIWRLLDENRPLLRLLASLFGTSAFLTKGLIAHPELLDSVLAAGAARAPLIVDTRNEEDAWNDIRRFKNEELLRIGLGDVGGQLELEEVHARLSDLADTSVRVTYDLVRGALERRHGKLAPMVVLGLGKLGAREMGYASDLDLVFVYDGDLDDHERMSKLAQRLVNALAAYTEEGRLYEVDTRLRPSGQKGTLVSSLTAWRAYHAKDARLWERQALIRCRAVAGDDALGRAVEEEAARFVYDEPRDPRAVTQEVVAMRARIEAELAKETPGAYDIKTGRGGLLDVEFAAQLLQLLHGPAHPALRVRATLQALEAAAAAGLIDERARSVLVGGYRFLRRIENRMRIVHDRPIHEFPRDPAELDKLARRCGLPSGGALERTYLAWTRDVRQTWQELTR